MNCHSIVKFYKILFKLFQAKTDFQKIINGNIVAIKEQK